MGTQLVEQKSPTRFSAITQQTLGRRISINPLEERITSIVASSARIQGNLAYEEGVKVDGEIKGSLEFGRDDGLCIVSRSAVVDGDIKGPRAFILGTVEGDITIDGLVVIAPTAVIIGNITYGRIIVLEGAQISGQISMNVAKPLQRGGDVADTSIVRLRGRRDMQPSVSSGGRAF